MKLDRRTLTWQHLLFAGFGLFVAATAIAQTASEITPPSFQPPEQRLSGSLVFSGEPGLVAPEGADRLTVRIAEVDVEGGLPELRNSEDALRERLSGRTVRVSEIFDAASALEQSYIEAGFVLARVVLPAQELRDGGNLRLVVVDGFVESIDTEAVPERVRERIEALTSSLIGRRGLTLSELERRLLLAGDTYGIALGSALAAGATPGGTVVILQPRYRQITGFAGFDNTQTDALGEWSVNGGVELNGFLGYGEVLYGRVSGYPKLSGDGGFFGSNPRNRTFALGAVVPIGREGLSFSVEYTNSRTAPADPFVPTASEFERLTFGLYYPAVRTRALNVTGRLSLDLQNDTLDILSVAGDLPVYEDKSSVVRAAVDAVWLRPSGSVIEAGAKLSFGVDAFGARSLEDIGTGTPFSRASADSDFRKLEISARLRQQLSESYALTLSGRSQFSFGDALLTSEQFGIATIQELSAFDEGTLTGDSGWVVRGEISSLVEMNVADQPLDLRPYIFAAKGKVNREVPLFGEAETVHADSFGLGLEAILVRDQAFSTASIRLEVADGDRDDGGNDDTRVTVFGSLRF